MKPRRRWLPRQAGARLLAAARHWTARLLPARALPWLAAASYLAAITALAQGTGLKLLLFPELGALAAVVFSDPASRWARSPWLLVGTPTLTAMAGILVSTHLPYGPLAVSLTVAAGLLVLRLLRSPVAPALSAGYLPVVLGIRSWTYPLAILIAISGLVVVMGLRKPWRQPADGSSAGPDAPAIGGDGGATPKPQGPLTDPSTAGAVARNGAEKDPPFRFPPAKRWLLPLAVFLAGALLLVERLASPLVLSPPFLVIAWETLAQSDHCPWRRRPGALLVVTTIAALIGLVLAHGLGPSPLAAFLAMLLTALVLDRMGLSCPPAFAVALLPLVVPQPPTTYPLLVLAGGGWLVAVAAWRARSSDPVRANG